MTLQKLLEAHVEKAAAEIYPHNSLRRHAFKSGAALTTPLLLAAVEAMSLVQQNHRLVHKEKCYPNPSDDTRVVCLCGSEKLTETLSLIAASLKREG